MNNVDKFLSGLAGSYSNPSDEDSNKVIRSEVISVSFDGVPLRKMKASELRKGNLREKGKSGRKVAPCISRVFTMQPDEFLCLMNKAGKRSGKLVDDNLRKEDERNAINAFVGYSYGEPHGTQKDNAIRKARAMCMGTGPDIQKKEYQGGYVHGMPNFEKKRTDDITARIAASLDAIREADKEGNELKVKLEEERIAHIQKLY